MKAGLIAAGVLLLAGCSGTAADDVASHWGATVDEYGWERLPDAPLRPRDNAIVERLGQRVVVLGGQEAHDCAGQLSCYVPPNLLDGAVYNLTTEQWTLIAEPPADAVGGWQRVVSGDRLYVLGDVPGRRVHEYDASKDAWTTYPRPPHVYRGDDTLAATKRFVYVARSDDSAATGIDRLDLRTSAWTTLSPSPHRPTMSLRTLLPTKDGLVVAGSAVNDAAKILGPIVERLQGGQWHRFNRAPEDVRGVHWIRVGAKVMAPEGWHRHPGAILDLRTGSWEPVLRKPDQAGWSIGHAMGSDMYSTDGFTYDGRSDTWLLLTSPSDASHPGMGAWVDENLFVVDHASRTWWLRDVR